MNIKLLVSGAVLSLTLAGVASAGAYDDGVFTITATNSQLTTTYPGATTFANSSTFAGYSGSVVTPVATITGGALNPGGSTNPDTGIDNSIANYLAAYNGNSETIAFGANQKYFGTLWGSVDVTNTISFYENANLVASYTGAYLESGDVGLEAWPNPGSFVDFAADGSSSDFNRIVLSEDTTFFETDNYASIAAVPEPAIWASMMLGLFGVGAALRRRRKLEAGAALA